MFTFYQLNGKFYVKFLNSLCNHPNLLGWNCVVERPVQFQTSSSGNLSACWIWSLDLICRTKYARVPRALIWSITCTVPRISSCPQRDNCQHARLPAHTHSAIRYTHNNIFFTNLHWASQLCSASADATPSIIYNAISLRSRRGAEECFHASLKHPVRPHITP